MTVEAVVQMEFSLIEFFQEIISSPEEVAHSKPQTATQ